MEPQNISTDVSAVYLSPAAAALFARSRSCVQRDPRVLTRSVSFLDQARQHAQIVPCRYHVYRERVTVTSSGTPDQPINFRGAGSGATITGPTAGFAIDGQHDIVIQSIRAINVVDVPALDVRNASAITVKGGGYAMGDALEPGATDTLVVNNHLSAGGNEYVAAEGAGTLPLLAGHTAISTWEKFTLG